MRHIIIIMIIGLALAAPVVGESLSATTTLISPPAIYMPAGGKVVTEINVSDDDVLGVIKKAIPALADVAKDIAPQAGKGDGNPITSIAGNVDLTGLSDAISGIKSVRVLIARYPVAVSAEKFLDEFNKGAAKAGHFSKILSDFGTFPGAVGLYALPNNEGCMGFAYDPRKHTAYAARVVGGIDVPKLIKWGGGIAKMFVGTKNQSSIETPPPGVEPAEPIAPPAAVEENK